VGIGRPREGQAAADRVLGEFEPGELPLVAEMVERAAAAVRTLIRDGLTSAMNRYNLRVQVSGG
jgi:PTH1 family peptidyl-tRNA hydrolase